MAGKIIGILALQGSVAEHQVCLDDIYVKNIRVTTAQELDRVDALIIPGGESTAIGNLLKTSKLFEPIIQRVKSGMAVWGTCAGAILLARSIQGEAPHLNLMDIEIRRNAYGRQLDSFVCEGMIKGIGKYPMVFIRAPIISSAGEGVQILARVNNNIVAARQNNMLVSTFHPELTQNNKFHKFFVEKVCNRA